MFKDGVCPMPSLTQAISIRINVKKTAVLTLV